MLILKKAENLKTQKYFLEQIYNQKLRHFSSSQKSFRRVTKIKILGNFALTLNRKIFIEFKEKLTNKEKLLSAFIHNTF
jgi:hypothetical protein